MKPKGTKEVVVELEVLGNRLTVRTQGEPEVAQEAVELAKIKLKDAEKRAKGAQPFQVALLALLDMSEEYVKAKKRAKGHREAATQKFRKLLAGIEAEAG